jgi:cephalosporin hydroxylase
MSDPMARGGVRRYLDTVKPEEYVPDTGEVNLAELSLTGLADLYGSDKGTIKHNYTLVYERIVESLCEARKLPRKSCPLHILEAGVACGASLRMWANYLPASTITGYDVRPECASLCGDLKNVRIRIADPATEARPESMLDLFVDDASHIAEQIVAMFRNCWGWVRPGGYYIVEDLLCTYNEGYTKQFRQHFDPKAVNDRAAIMAMIDQLMRAVDARGEVAEFSYYPQLLVLRKAA